jgi:hypothetical protein
MPSILSSSIPFAGASFLEGTGRAGLEPIPKCHKSKGSGVIRSLFREPFQAPHAAVSALWHFRDKCCFQVIYFVPNFSFLDPIETRLAAGVETIRLRDAVKIACVRSARRVWRR